MQPGWKGRAGVWLALAESVRANRGVFPDLPTAWVPHGAANTLALWLPELLAGLDRVGRLGERCPPGSTVRGFYDTAQALCVRNPRWAFYVAPAALGYAVSHPRFNIYKEPMSEWKLAGFGLDAIPHSLTAFALAHAFQDGITTLARCLPKGSPLAPLVRGLAAHPAWVSGAALALLTAVWESGEFAIQQEELRRTGGDPAAINMEWTLENTLFDALANFVGWGIAAWQGQSWAEND